MDFLFQISENKDFERWIFSNGKIRILKIWTFYSAIIFNTFSYFSTCAWFYEMNYSEFNKVNK